VGLSLYLIRSLTELCLDIGPVHEFFFSPCDPCQDFLRRAHIFRIFDGFPVRRKLFEPLANHVGQGRSLQRGPGFRAATEVFG
jgi:hypothetical protein